MSDPAARATRWETRPLRADDIERVISIDEQHTGERKPEYWKRVFAEYLRADPDILRVGLAAEAGGSVIGYLTGEVRAFEFGSEACGWILALGVDPAHARERIASRLLAAACRRFQEAGVTTVRTMVQRNDVPVLSFFRANGFVGGSFVQLELDLAAG